MDKKIIGYKTEEGISVKSPRYFKESEGRENMKVATPVYEKEILYGFYYNSCIHESAWGLQSLHRSKENAEKAMNDHKEKEKLEYEKYKKYCEKDDLPFGEFGAHENWCVEEVEVLP